MHQLHLRDINAESDIFVAGCSQETLLNCIFMNIGYQFVLQYLLINKENEVFIHFFSEKWKDKENSVA